MEAAGPGRPRGRGQLAREWGFLPAGTGGGEGRGERGEGEGQRRARSRTGCTRLREAAGVLLVPVPRVGSPQTSPRL